MDQYIKQVIKKFTTQPIYLVLGLALLLGAPTLTVGWALVDDGKSAQVAFELSKSLSEGDLNNFVLNLLEFDSGRFRPGYWFYLWITFLVAGNSAFLHHFIHLGIFISTSLVTFWLVAKLFATRLGAFLATAFFISNWQILENWYRLGPQEPIVLFLLIISLSFFILLKESCIKSGKEIKNRTWLLFIGCLILLIFANLVKETVIIFSGVALYFLIVDLILHSPKKILIIDLIYFLTAATAGLGSYLLAQSIYSSGDYAQNYHTSVLSIMTNFQQYQEMIKVSYNPLLMIILILFGFKVATSLLNIGFSYTIRKYYWSGLFLAWFLAFFIVQLPWGFTIARYLQVPLVGLCIILGVETASILDQINASLKNPRMRKRADLLLVLQSLQTGIIVMLVTIFFYHIFMSFVYISFVKNVTNFNEKILLEISRLAPPNSKVYLNVESVGEPHIELYKEIDWHLDYVFNRPDIYYAYIPKDYRPLKDDLILSGSVETVIAPEFLEASDGKLISSFETTTFWITLNSPQKLIEHLINNSFKLVRSQPINSDLFFATSANHYKWKIHSFENIN